jgi:8-oxo-dGTP pyrophosphatase MutT (NUDIX family)
MPIPDFIVALRRQVGTTPLWLSGVTAVVVRDVAATGRPGTPELLTPDLLLVRRADTGAWTPVTGIIDPGEQPADAAVREVAEESGVTAVPVRLALVHVSDPVVYDNGDRAQYLDLVFRMTWTAGEPHPADGENTDAAWFPLDALPELGPSMRMRIEAALAHEVAARFLVGSA